MVPKTQYDVKISKLVAIQIVILFRLSRLTCIINKVGFFLNEDCMCQRKVC